MDDKIINIGGNTMKTTYESLQERIMNAIQDHGGDLTPKVKELIANFTEDVLEADQGLSEVIEK